MGEECRLLAHSARPGLCDRQLLREHLREVSRLARAFAEPFGGGDLAGLIGLLHDVGKGKDPWQRGLIDAEAHERSTGERRRVGVAHKAEAAWILAQAWPGLELAQLAYGHHHQIPSVGGLRRILAKEDGAEITRTVARTAAEVPEINDPVNVKVPKWLLDIEPVSARLGAFDVLLRMVASCVYDADVLDVIRHELNLAEPPLHRGPDLGDLVERFEANRSRFLAARAPSGFDAMRVELGELARVAGVMQPGFVRMPYPTGSGKTISAARFAVHHAARWGQRRLIYAAPYLTITEQNASELRRMFTAPDGTDPVLEHHSAVEFGRLPTSPGGDAAPGVGRAVENWDAPVVVTTVVQLFESLFSNRPGALRKVHRLGNSVIVLDEVQALPDRLLPPILSALRVLVEHFGTTVVLCTATQPAFESLRPLVDAEASGLMRDVVTDPKRYVAQARRVTYEWRLDPAPRLEDIGEELAAQRQVLAIVNTTADSARLHRLVVECGAERALHLSTRMQVRHRRHILSQIRQLLAEGAPLAVVATQLVEAGVSLDFPTVYRALAGADSLAQAAGRANREGLLEGFGRVVVFDPVDGGAPPSIAAAISATRPFFGPGKADPDDPDALRAYFRERYANAAVDENQGVAAAVEKARAAHDYETVTEKFRMIDDFAVPVLVKWSALDHSGVQDERELARFDRLLALARRRGGASREEMRELMQWSASIPRYAALGALGSGLAAPVVGDLLLWNGHYDRDRGIELDRPDRAAIF